MPMTDNVDPPAGRACSGGTRSKTGTNYGDWTPTRARGPAAVQTHAQGDRGYNPVGMAYKGPRDAPDELAEPPSAATLPADSPAGGPAGRPHAMPLARSPEHWWDRLKSLFHANHGAPQASAPRTGSARTRAVSSATDESS